jgi:hypothetical protein
MASRSELLVRLRRNRFTAKLGLGQSGLLLDISLLGIIWERDSPITIAAAASWRKNKMIAQQVVKKCMRIMLMV